MIIRGRVPVGVLVALAVLAGSSMAQERAPSDDPFGAFDPARDDPAILAGLAAEASRAGTLPELRAWLDSLRVEGRAGEHALVYWGALSLRARIDPDSVAAVFGRHLAEHPGASAALAAFIRVLEANAAIDEADWLRRAVAQPGAVSETIGSPASGATESLVADLEEARRSDDLENVRRALERAIAAGLPPTRVALLRGDLQLARGQPDSAAGVWASAVGAAPRPEALAALGRVRLVQSLRRAGAGAKVLAILGRILVVAPADPRVASASLDSLAMIVSRTAGQSGDSTGVASALLAGLAAESVGQADEPLEASRALEAAARGAGPEGAELLLAAGRWARAAREEERARGLWRQVVERYPGTPHDLEARRLLSEPEPGRRR